MIIGDRLKTSVDPYNGGAAFSLDLVTLPGRNGVGVSVSISYSGRVQQQAATWNLQAPTGLLGLGWELSSLKRIVAVQNGVAVNGPPDYFLLSNGAANRLLQSGAEGTKQLYTLENWLPWRITYDPSSERWELIDEDGVTSVYGDLSIGGEASSADAPASRNTVQWNVAWGNWIDSGSHTTGQRRYVTAWLLADVIDRWGDTASWSYDSVDVATSNASGLAFTAAVYPLHAVASDGTSVAFRYGDKTAAELQEAHTNPGPPNAWQDRIERRYLAGVDVYASNGTRLYTEQLDYGAPTFLGTGSLTKRLLVGIQRVHNNGGTLPGLRFSYWGQDSGDGVTPSVPFNPANGALYGAMKVATLPEGGTYTWEYQSIVAGHSNRAMTIARPVVSGFTFTKPRIVFNDAYTAVTWLGTSAQQSMLAIQAFTWDGQWLASSVATATIASSAAYDAAQLAAGAGCFVVLCEGKLYPFALDVARAGMLVAPATPFSPALVGAEMPQLVCGDTFAAVVGTESGKLSRFRFDGMAWQSDELITIPVSTPASFSIAAKNNLLVAGGIRTDTNDAPLFLRIYRRDGTGAWAQSPQFHTAPTLAPVSALSLFAGDTFVVWRGVQPSGSGNSVKFGVALWNAQFTTISAQEWETQILPSATPIPAPVIASSLVAVGQKTRRYDGEQWIAFDAATITYPNQSSVDVIQVAEDVIVRRIAQGAGQWTNDLIAFDPNTNRWSNPAAVAVPSTTPQAVAAPRRGMRGNYAIVGNAVRYCSWTGSWNDTAVTLAGIASAIDANSVQVLPEFVVYQSGSGTSGVATRVYLLANGTASAATPASLPGEQIVITGQAPDTLVGTSAFVTYTGTWDTGASVLKLYRVVGAAFSETQNAYAVRRVIARNGYPDAEVPGTFPIGYVFDAASATMNPFGVSPQFNLAKVLPGDDEASYGAKLTAFFNGLPPGLAPAIPYPVDSASANAQTYYSLAKRIVYEAQNRIGVTTAASSSLTRWQWMTINRVAACGVSFYTRSRKIADALDGVVTTSTNEFSTVTGLVTKTTRDNTDLDSREQFFSREFIYAWQKYDAMRTANILTPVAQMTARTRTTGATPAEVITGVAVLTWSADWGSGEGQWAPYRMFSARTADAPAFNAWLPTDPDPDGWLRLTTAVRRNSRGAGLLMSGIGAQALSAGYDTEDRVIVWSCMNASAAAGEIAWFGCEPYESASGWAWSDPAKSILDFLTTADSHTGTQSISLPPAPGRKEGPTRTFQPSTQHRRFLFSLWAKHANGFNSANGKAFVEIAVRDVTSSEWLTPVAIQIAGAAGTWSYIQRVLDLDALRGSKPSTDVLALEITAYDQNTSAGCYVDELRFCPLDSTFQATVYDPTRFDVTSSIGHNGQNDTTIYDAFARPIAAIGPLGRVDQVLSASYSRTLTPADAFQQSYPNSTLELATSSFSRYDDFHDDHTADWTFSDPSQWQIADGSLQHRGASSAPLGSTAQLNVVAFRNFAARILVRPETPLPTTIALGNNDVFLRWNGSQWQLVQLVDNTVNTLAVSSLEGLRSEWIFACVDGFILCYADGVQIFSHAYTYPATPPAGWGKVTLAVSGDCDFDELIVLQEPQLSLSFSDGLGQPAQRIALQGRAIDGPYATQYPAAVTGTFYDALGRPLSPRVELTAPLAIAPPAAADLTDPPPASLVVANESTYLRTDGGQALTVRQFLDGVGGFQYQQLTYEASPLSRIKRSVPPRPSASDASLAAVDIRYDGAATPAPWLSTDPDPNEVLRFRIVGLTYKQTVDGIGGTPRYQRTYDRCGRLLLALQGKIDGNPNKEGYLYDAAGRLAEVRPPNFYRPPAGSTAASWVRRYEYDFLGPNTKETTPDTGVTQFMHDDAGRLRFKMDAAGAALTPQQIQYLRYDSLGRCVETGYIQDAAYQWASAALRGKVNVPQFPVVDAAMQNDPNFAAGQWRKQFVWDYRNDPAELYAAGALVEVRLNNGDATNPDKETYAFDAWGNITSSKSSVRSFDANKEWTFGWTYDRQDRISLITYPVMDSETPVQVGYSYDRLGRLAAVGNAVDPGGVVDPDNPPPIPEKYWSDLAYSPKGYLARQILNNGSGKPRITRNYAYSDAGALQSISDDYAMETIGWDGSGAAPARTDYFSGIVVSDTFDYYSGSRWANPPADYGWSLRNDSTGELKQAANSLDANWSLSIGGGGQPSFDPNGNILSTTRGLTVTSYGYTKSGVRTNRLDHTTSTGSDDLDFTGVPPTATSWEGWSWESSNGGPSTSAIDTTQGHNTPPSLRLGGGSLGHYERLSFQAYLPTEGTLTIVSWVKTAAGFDTATGEGAWFVSLENPDGTVIEVRLGAVPAGAANWTQLTVTRDIAALRAQLGAGRNVTLVTVELRNTKRGSTGSSGPSFLVDDISLVATATGTFTYDASGRMTTSSARNITGVAYDPVASVPRSITTTSSAATLTYNASDLRALEVVTASGTTEKTLHLRGISRLPLITRTTGPGGTATTYWVLGPGGIIAYKRGTAETFVLQDHLGSTRLLVDGATGAAADSIDYLPFGDVMRRSGSSAIDFLYTGQQRDDTTGLYNYNARLYDPAAGRFLQPDSAAQFPTPYSYVGTQPFTAVDPSGRNAIVLIRSTKTERFLGYPNSGHTGVLVSDPGNPGLWIYRDIIPTADKIRFGCGPATYRVWWFQVDDPRATGTEPNYPSNRYRNATRPTFATHVELVNYLKNDFPLFEKKADAILEVTLTPEQDRALIDAYELYIEKQQQFCPLGLNCASFAGQGFRRIGLPPVPKESVLWGFLLLPAAPVLGGNPAGAIATPNSLYHTIASSKLDVTYHKDLEETRYNTLTSVANGSAAVIVPVLEAVFVLQIAAILHLLGLLRPAGAVALFPATGAVLAVAGGLWDAYSRPVGNADDEDEAADASRKEAS